MALSTRTLSSHNRSLGQQIQHPLSTKFYDSLSSPSAKRVKREHSEDSVVATPDASEYEEAPPLSPSLRPPEIPDSEAESSDDEAEERQKPGGTTLESALPPVRTDKDAIREYEATRAAEAAELDLHGRLGERKWVHGKSSIYVDAFNLALETVLEDEAHLFDATELALFDHWRSLSYEGQYLYVRLFLRKTAAWHRINRLGYYSDIPDIQAPVNELLQSRKLPIPENGLTRYPGELDQPANSVLGSHLSFADTSDDHINTLQEASSLLRLDELKAIAKEAKVQGKNKTELLRSLRKTSGHQTGLGWSGLKRSDTEQSIISEDNAIEEDTAYSEEQEGLDAAARNCDSHFTKKILSNTGPCIRLSSAPQKLFERVHLIFYRSTEWTEKSLTTIILARISRRTFPDYVVSRSKNIFPSRAEMLEFEASLRTQFRIDSILEFNGTVQKDGLQVVKEIFEEVYPRWKVIVAEEQRKEDRVYETGEGAYLRRFSPAWVYTRIVHKGTYVLGRFKEHQREHQVLSELLDQNLFHAARRGAWYQRNALLEEHYMWALTPVPGLSEEAQKRHWKQVALRTCEAGLRDRDCHLIYHYDLQKRVMKLEKALKIPKREHHDFGHVKLAKPLERTFHGVRIENEKTSSRNCRRYSAGSDSLSARRGGGKTIWLDEREDNAECSVEAMCLSHYRNDGWKGYHSEGGIVRTLFGLLFYDVLFVYIPNVFQTPYQTCPLDLHTDSFYPSRASEINHRLVEIGNGNAEQLLKDVWDREAEKETCVVGVHWDYDINDLLEIVRCFEGEALATLCKLMAQEYQQRGGGIPDLFLWKLDLSPEEGANGNCHGTVKEQTRGEVMFAEVKSENDRLSDTQRLWIHVLTAAGIRVELCAAVAKEVKVV